MKHITIVPDNQRNLNDKEPLKRVTEKVDFELAVHTIDTGVALGTMGGIFLF